MVNNTVHYKCTVTKNEAALFIFSYRLKNLKGNNRFRIAPERMLISFNYFFLTLPELFKSEKRMKLNPYN